MITLHYIHPEINARRYYTLDVVTDLFGAATLVKSWGRIGTRGQQMLTSYDTRENARTAMDQLARRKMRKGYRRMG